MRDELGNERHVGLFAEDGLLHHVDGFLRELARLCEFLAALAEFFTEHGEAPRAAAVVERAHLGGRDERVALVPEDDVELLHDGFVHHVYIHPGAARKQDNLLAFLLELQPVQVRVHGVCAVFQFLAHVGVDHPDYAVHQDLHLAGNAEQVQRETPDDDVRVGELLAHPGNVVALDEAAAVFAAPAAEASAAGLYVQPVDKEVFGFIVAVLFEPLHERLRGNKRSAALVFRTCDHHEYLLFICHVPKFS